jgi:hypothetical protein
LILEGRGLFDGVAELVKGLLVAAHESDGVIGVLRDPFAGVPTFQKLALADGLGLKGGKGDRLFLEEPDYGAARFAVAPPR